MELSYDGQPLGAGERTVPADWIDYNGHMNVAYYTMAFDQALDEAYDALGIGPGLVKAHNMGPMALQTQIFYLGELVEGERLACDFRLLDADEKRVHVFLEMRNLDRDTLAATYESLTLNVDLEARRGAAFPQDAQERIRRLLEAQGGLEHPSQVGRTIGIRRKPG